jgi:hypothetical protein
MAHYTVELAESWSDWEGDLTVRSPEEERRFQAMVDDLLEDATRRLNDRWEEMAKVLGRYWTIRAQERGWEARGFDEYD